MTDENIMLSINYKKSTYDVEISDIEIMESDDRDSAQLVFNTHIENENNLDDVSCYEINKLVKEYLYGALVRMIGRDGQTNG